LQLVPEGAITFLQFNKRETGALNFSAPYFLEGDVMVVENMPGAAVYGYGPK